MKVSMQAPLYALVLPPGSQRSGDSRSSGAKCSAFRHRDDHWRLNWRKKFLRALKWNETISIAQWEWVTTSDISSKFAKNLSKKTNIYSSGAGARRHSMTSRRQFMRRVRTNAFRRLSQSNKQLATRQREIIREGIGEFRKLLFQSGNHLM